MHIFCNRWLGRPAARRYAGAAAVALLGILWAGLAYAQVSMSDMPTVEQLQQQNSSDIVLQALKGLLGDQFVSNPFSTVGVASTMLGKMFFEYNAILFVVGTAWVLYFAGTTVAVSAHEGEFMGQRMNSLWIPIRVGTGVFSMIPVFSGYTLAQAVMMFVALLGNGAGNLLSQVAIESNDSFQTIVPAPSLTTSSTSSGKPSVSIDVDMANALFAMNVCQLAVNDYYTKLNGGSSSTQVTVQNDSTGVMIQGSDVICGGVKIIDQTGNLRDNTTLVPWVQSLGFRNPAVDYENIKSVATSIKSGRQSALSSLQSSVASIASSWYSTVKDGDFTNAAYPFTQLATAAENAEETESQTTQASIQTLQNTNQMADPANNAVKSEVVARMRQGGWAAIGSWYSLFAETQAAMQSAASASQLVVTPMDLRGLHLPESLSKLFGSMEMLKAKEQEQCLSVNLPVVGKTPGIDRNVLGACAPMQNGFLFVLDAIMTGSGGTGMINPVIASKNLGDWLLVGVGTVTSMGVVSSVVDKLSFVPGVGWAAKAAGGLMPDKIKGLFSPFSGMDPNSFGGRIASFLFMGALILGMIAAVYIPFIPFLTWMSALASYFVSVIEGFIAAQVWAFSHLNGEGEGMGQKAQKGYIYLLNVLLRPMLMVMGFFFASAILTLMGTIFFGQFGTALANVQGNTMTGPFIIIATTAVVVFWLLTLVQTIFNMIYEIPDRVIGWFGGGMEARTAQSMDSAVDQKVGRATQTMGHGLATALGRGA